jgi:benzoyl-CoA reductase/2-hydroxyglutaryl-CoA dehydratase subunit BcrC/BadD/HgdB
MSSCCGKKPADITTCDPCAPPEPACAAGNGTQQDRPGAPLAWFADMVNHCYEYATAQKQAGRHLVGIMCEFTPREIIMAANAMPVCLCGGSVEMIPPAEDYLPANLCPLIKSTFGFSVEKSNPFLEMADLLVAETTCDGKKKMYELLSQRHEMHVLELPQKPDDPEAFEHWLAELHKLKQALADRFGVKITDEALREAARSMNRERRLRRSLAGLMKSDAPPFSGRELLDLKSLISCIPCDIEQYKKVLEHFGNNSGKACSGDGKRPARVLLTGVPTPHGAERVLDIIESHGGQVVCQENCTGLKPILQDVDADAPDIMRAIAEKYFHLPCSVMTPNTRRLDSLRQLAGEYRVDCIVDLVWQACITYDVEAHAVRRLADEMELPYLRIETDYSPSDSARIAVRVEALFETVATRTAIEPQ